jgi:hypothetical protein
VIGGGVTLREGSWGSWLVGSTFPHGFIFGLLIPLDLVELSSLVACDLVFLVENLDRICLIRQIQFQWNGVFDNHICWRLQTSLELGDMKHIMNP